MDSVKRRDGTRFEKKVHLLMEVKKGEIPVIESTSPYNNYPTRPISQMAPGEYWVVGPSPEKRKWYATFKVRLGGRFSVQ